MCQGWKADLEPQEATRRVKPCLIRRMEGERGKRKKQACATLHVDFSEIADSGM